MINRFWLTLVRVLLWFRYRVRVTGMGAVADRGRTGVLFLPNHPAFIDPVILLSRLMGPFKVRALADRDQTDRFLIRSLVRRFRMFRAPDLSKPGTDSAGEVRAVIADCVAALRAGDNLLLYPAGRLQSRRTTEIGANSAVHRILGELPHLRVVLVRTRGLWGSAFSRASGVEPDIGAILTKGAGRLLLSGLFFGPRRRVDIEFSEPADLPRGADRAILNRFLEDFYNGRTSPYTVVPYSIWDRRGTRELPEPEPARIEGDPASVPAATRGIVTNYLRELTGETAFDDGTDLSRDLGMDSLRRLEVVTWLQAEFGFPPGDTDSLQTVGDVMLAASGEAITTGPKALAPVRSAWFRAPVEPVIDADLPQLTLTGAFLRRARRSPGAVVIADQTSGVKTYRDLLLGVMALRPALAALEGETVGVMMPATVAAGVMVLATLFAGKRPAMINWTLGRANLGHCMKLAGVRQVFSSRTFVERLEGKGVDLEAVGDRFVFVEDIAGRISMRRKAALWLRSRLNLHGLGAVRCKDPAVVLFTSGSESRPKAVPLSHRNILTNVRDACDYFTINRTHSILGILPPFHSFGLTTCVFLPLVTGLRAVYYPDPTDGAVLGRMIDAYGASILIGTPTFLNGIMRASAPALLKSLRLVVSGAEKCPERVYEAVRRKIPETVILEGYGVTECAPVISCNREDDARPGTIGRVVRSLDHVIVHPEKDSRVGPGEAGILLVRGSSVFAGYLGDSGTSPFVTFEGKQWYRTGDLVRTSGDGVLTFAGRLKRFVKLGGEMVSLAAIEEVLVVEFASEDDEGPILAVAATPVEEKPEIVLVTTKELSRKDANACIRAAGLSGLHNIRRVIRVEALPVLGTGKTDYRSLAEQLRNNLK